MTDTRRHAITAILTTGISALTMIIGIAVQITALTVSAGRSTTPSDVGLALATLALISLACSTPHALHTLYVWARDRGCVMQAEIARRDAALARGDTASVVQLGQRAK